MKNTENTQDNKRDIALNEKWQSKCKFLFKQKKKVEEDINECLNKTPLFFKCPKGQVKRSHPWMSTFGYGIQQGIFNINASLASHILDHFNNIESVDPSKSRRNRQKMRSNIKKYAKSMREGNWDVAASIIFEEGTGALLDGQNRLEALLAVAKEQSPNNLSDFSLDFSVIYGADQSIQDHVDKGSSRTIIQTARIKGLIADRDTNGISALKILEGISHKLSEGNGYDRSLANEADIFASWHEIEPNTEMSYEDICRWIAEMTSEKSAYELHLGHKICLAQGYIFNKEKTELFVECITADVDSLEELRERGIDTTFSTKEFSSVKVCRSYFKKLSHNKKLNGSNGGSAKPFHYGHMLYFLTQFLEGKKTSSICYRELSCDPKKLSQAKYVNLGECDSEEEEDFLQSLLNI